MQIRIMATNIENDILFRNFVFTVAIILNTRSTKKLLIGNESALRVKLANSS